MQMLVSHLASAEASMVEIADDLELDCSDTRASLRDVDQRGIADALMKCAVAEARPDEVERLQAGYRLALERDRLAVATR